MKVLLLCHISFAEKNGANAWLELFRQTLESQGLDAEIFKPEIHKIQDFTHIHGFGNGNLELLWNLEKVGKKVFLTPSLDDPETLTFTQTLLRHFALLLLNLKYFFFETPDERFFQKDLHHFVLPTKCSEAWSRQIGIKKNAKISHFNDSPEDCARVAGRSYLGSPE